MSFVWASCGIAIDFEQKVCYNWLVVVNFDYTIRGISRKRDEMILNAGVY